MRHRILVTGASGSIASQLLPEFRHRYELTLVDTTRGRSHEQGGDVIGLDLLHEQERLADLMAGHDTVVHLASRYLDGRLAHDERQHERAHELYEVERANLDMMQVVYRTAIETGVRRVVTASSNQASKWHEGLYHRRSLQNVAPEDYPKPVSFYGWAKVAYESLGFLYASGELGRALEVLAVRIVVPELYLEVVDERS